MKTYDEFDNDPIKFCVSNTKQKMKVDHNTKDIRNVFLSHRL
jgi:hypothetical protein